MKPSTTSSAQPSFLREEISKHYSGTEGQAMYLTMVSIIAGADNPRMTMNAWVMACLAYLTAIRRARDEPDQLCVEDVGRLPDINYLPKLSYACATIKEVIR